MLNLKEVVSSGLGADLCVWSGRLVSEGSLHSGSFENLVRKSQASGRSLVIANPGQLNWHQESGRAMSHHEFRCAGGRRMDQSNKIPGIFFR